MPAALDPLLRRLVRRRRAGMALASQGPVIAGGAMLGATAVAVIRLVMPDAGWAVPPVVAIALLAPLVALPRALARREPSPLVAGHLDRLAGADGLVMALAEQPALQRDPGWLARAQALLADVRFPPLDLRPLAGAFLGIACLVGATALPQATAPEPAPVRADPTVPLRAEVAELAQAQVLTPEERHELDQRLQALAAGGLDQTTWQGLDRLAQALDLQASAAGERLGAALQAADAAQQAPESRTAEHAAALGQALAELAEAAPGLLPAIPAGAAGEATREALGQALAEAARQGRLTPAQAAALTKAGLPIAKQAKGLSASQNRALARELQRRLDAKRNGLKGSRSATALERFLKKKAVGVGQKPGAGGVSRGPGHAPLDKVARERLDGGTREALAEGLQENPDGSVTVAAQARDPEADAAAQQALARAAARTFDPAAADARRAAVAPRHREAVAAYFAAEAPVPTVPPPSVPAPQPIPRATPRSPSEPP